MIHTKRLSEWASKTNAWSISEMLLGIFSSLANMLTRTCFFFTSPFSINTDFSKTNNKQNRQKIWCICVANDNLAVVFVFCSLNKLNKVSRSPSPCKNSFNLVKRPPLLLLLLLPLTHCCVLFRSASSSPIHCQWIEIGVYPTFISIIGFNGIKK